MNQQKTVMQGIVDTVRLIVDKLLGRRYYFVVAGLRGADFSKSGTIFISSDIFTTRSAALARLESLGNNSSYFGLEVRSFRSRKVGL